MTRLQKATTRLQKALGMSGTFSGDLSLTIVHVSSEFIMFINEVIFAWAKMIFKDFALKAQSVFGVVVCGKWGLSFSLLLDD